MVYPIYQYLKFLLKSKNQHSVHSPFIFNLVTQCFYDKSYHEDYKTLLKHHKTLDKNSLKISRKKMKLLYRFAQYYTPKNILELNNSPSMVPYTFGLGNPKSQIASLVSSYSKTTNTLTHYSTLNSQIKALSTNNYDLVFFGKKLQKEAVLSAFDTLLKTVTKESVFVFESIHDTKERLLTWEIIKKNAEVKVTVDTFFLSFVFFRKEQAKEHFTIRV